MNALDLPPRRPLPRETRDRIRRTVDAGTTTARARSRAPIAVAACVAALALGAVVVAQWAPGDREDRSPAATRPSTTVLPDGAVIPPVTMDLPDARTQEDLDRCGDVVAASPRADEFTPRSSWRPSFTTTAPDGARITAFRGGGGKPGFCEVTGTTAAVSDPTAEWTPIAVAPEGLKPASVFAVYYSPTGVLAGVAEDVDALEFTSVVGTDIQSIGTPAFREGLFVVNLGGLAPGRRVNVIGRNNQGMAVVDGWTYNDPDDVPLAGAHGPVG